MTVVGHQTPNDYFWYPAGARPHWTAACRDALPPRPGLLQGELVIPQRLIDFELQHVEGDVVLLVRPEKFEARGEADAIIVFVIGVARIGRQVALLVVNILPMGLQVGAAEDDLAREKPARQLLSGSQPVRNLPADSMSLRIVKNLISVFQNGDVVFRVDGTNQERVVNILRTDALHGLIGVGGSARRCGRLQSDSSAGSTV